MAGILKKTGKSFHGSWQATTDTTVTGMGLKPATGFDTAIQARYIRGISMQIRLR